ncbi:hypothetical protein GCM10010922_19670 [Microbacterium sorbitolivorans]|uniref:DUF1003 domain-containing protein n=1 Tax=Microbacterium sorbitolivorans TaxID=1867410 RepID=A0A367Y7W4_9MICO|nr:DUF1003 domain-containing protein [Microbacterium sorbitolivorans]RCK61976.1 DUF1003 domain-containing protein [Microbacterium sorbitolivorans]GGF44132.1 hypothetical protein GCM10010922_19670 [Microbacterium sorbitolivorans]
MVRGENGRFVRGRRPRIDDAVHTSDRFGRATEWVARAMGTPSFLLILTVFCILWMAWNTIAPDEWRFDSAAIGFTALTLILSLQASYAAPLLLLAQNRQDDRDRVALENDRQRAERNLADTEYLAREIVSLRLTLGDLQKDQITRETLRDALRDIAHDTAHDTLRDEIREEIRAELRAEIREEMRRELRDESA